MVNIKVGDKLNAKDARQGTGARGEYYLIEKKADKGSDRVTVWATNPGDLVGAAEVTVERIKGISYYHKKDDKTGNWWPVVSVSADLKVSKLANQAPPSEFMDLVDEKDVKDIFGLDF